MIYICDRIPKVELGHVEENKEKKKEKEKEKKKKRGGFVSQTRGKQGSLFLLFLLLRCSFGTLVFSSNPSLSLLSLSLSHISSTSKVFPVLQSTAKLCYSNLDIHHGYFSSHKSIPSLGL